MRIAVCDDSAREMAALMQEIKEYPSLAGEISAYGSAAELLRDYAGGVRHDLLFLDIQMDGLDGLTAAARLRERYGNELPLIIFVTVTSEYVFDGYGSRVIGYLAKPVIRERLFRKLDEAHAEFFRGALPVQTAEGTFLVPFHEIQYIEANGNAPIIVTKAKTYRPRMTLDDMMRKLPRLTFLKTHRRFVVNLAHVRKYDERYLYFADSCKASISRDQRKEIIRAIKDYLR